MNTQKCIKPPTDPSCLTAAGERRLNELIIEYSTDEERVEEWIERNADIVASLLLTAPESMFNEIMTRIRAAAKIDAYSDLLEEDYDNG